MTISQAVTLGVVQGLTEFFPISSSGHLVILQRAFGMKEPQLAFDIFLHLGTLVSIFIFFWKDIVDLCMNKKKMLLFIIAASIPTFIIAFLAKDLVERLFASPRLVGCMLLVTAAWLTFADFYSKRFTQKKELGLVNSVIIGIAQGIAVTPGISRSGATIATGIVAGLDRELAFRFSFLLAVPVILGATLFKIRDITSGLAASQTAVFVLGGVSATLTGILAIKVLLRVVKTNRLGIFGIYCALAGLFIIISA